MLFQQPVHIQKKKKKTTKANIAEYHTIHPLKDHYGITLLIDH